MRSAGICASDLRFLAGGTEKIFGHKLAGVRQDGTPVSVEGCSAAAGAVYCLEGRNNLGHQATKMAPGIMQDDGMVEQFRVPWEKLVPLPESLDVARASLVEPASVSWHGVRLGGASPEGSWRW